MNIHKKIIKKKENCSEKGDLAILIIIIIKNSYNNNLEIYI